MNSRPLHEPSQRLSAVLPHGKRCVEAFLRHLHGEIAARRDEAQGRRIDRIGVRDDVSMVGYVKFPAPGQAYRNVLQRHQIDGPSFGEDSQFARARIRRRYLERAGPERSLVAR